MIPCWRSTISPMIAWLKHVRLDLNFSQTFREGPRVSDLESNYYNIRAEVVYEPFKKKEKKVKKGKKGGGQ